MDARRIIRKDAKLATETPIYDRVQNASHTLGALLMDVSRAQWLAVNAGHTIRLAKEHGAASALIEAEFAARDAMQQSNSLLARVKIALNALELPL